MFALDYQLKDQKDFKEVKERGKLYQSKNFGVRVLKKDKKETSQFGLVVSNKISKFAVHRNRIKRAIKEGIRQNIFRVRHGYNMVFLIKKGITSKTIEEIMSEVEAFLKNKDFSG